MVGMKELMVSVESYAIASYNFIELTIINVIIQYSASLLTHAVVPARHM